MVYLLLNKELKVGDIVGDLSQFLLRVLHQIVSLLCDVGKLTIVGLSIGSEEVEVTEELVLGEIL